MSHLVKTRGIVIRHAPYSETSRIIQWVTEDHGKLATIAKGAMRPRNPLLGQFDQLYTCELVYYGKDRDTVFVTRECTPVHPRQRFRTDWRSAAEAGYLADLTSRAVPAHDPIPEIFRLLDGVLNELDARGWSMPVMFLYELRLLAVLGLAPKLDRCASCGKTFPTGQSAAFSSRRGGMLCADCASTGDERHAGADVIAILNHWQKSEGWNVARAARCNGRQTDAIRALLGEFLSYHLDLPGMARNAAFELLAEPA